MSGDGTALRQQNVIRSLHPKITYVYSATFNLNPILSNSTAIQYGAFSFQLNQLPNYAAYQSIFDRYRILSVDVRFIPTNVQINIGTVNAPQFHTVVDFDDNSTPTSVTTLQRYSTYVGTYATTPFRRHFLPRAAVQVYDGVTTAYGEVDPMMWRDAAYPDIPHYALKYAMELSTPSNDYRYDVQCIMKVEFSGQR